MLCQLPRSLCSKDDVSDPYGEYKDHGVMATKEKGGRKGVEREKEKERERRWQVTVGDRFEIPVDSMG